MTQLLHNPELDGGGRVPLQDTSVVIATGGLYLFAHCSHGCFAGPRALNGSKLSSETHGIRRIYNVVATTMENNRGNSSSSRAHCSLRLYRQQLGVTAFTLHCSHC